MDVDSEAVRIVKAILSKHGIDPNSEEPLPPQVVTEIGAAAKLAAIRDHLVRQGR